MRRITQFVFILTIVLQVAVVSQAAELAFRDQELPTRLEVGYAVRLVDMNADQRLDIAIVDSKRFLWLENPNWQEHVVYEDKTAKADNVCFAIHDIDGDGLVDFATGRDWQPNNTQSGGTIGWLQQAKTPGQPWTYHSIGNEPTTHRMQFIDLDADGKMELVVSPLKGRNTKGPGFDSSGVRQLAYSIPEDPVKGPWKETVISDELHVTHNFTAVQWDDDPSPELLFVSFGGVHLLDRMAQGGWRSTHIGEGDQKSSPNRGASEIKVGKLANGGRYIATIEPWHGDKVVVYTKPDSAGANALWNRHVLDDQLKWGHGVWCANLDGDPEDELIIGVRDDLDSNDPMKRRGLRLYDSTNPQGTKWTRHLVDPGSVAIEDVTAGDLNGDGRVDIVAVGRQTHNVKVYWNESK